MSVKTICNPQKLIRISESNFGVTAANWGQVIRDGRAITVRWSIEDYTNRQNGGIKFRPIHTPVFVSIGGVRFKNRITVILSGTDPNQPHRAIIVLRDTWSPRNNTDKKHLTFLMFSLLQIKVENNNTEIGFLFYMNRLKKYLDRKKWRSNLKHIIFTRIVLKKNMKT